MEHADTASATTTGLGDEMSTTTPYESLVEPFDRDGYAIARKVLDADLMSEARDHVEWLQGRHPDLRGEELSHELVAGDPFWLRLVSDPRLLDLAAAFIGPDIALFASHYICKPAFSGQAVLWHQDSAYWPLDPMEVVTVWLAVDKSTVRNGCLRVVPGSHREPTYSHRDRGDLDNVLGSEASVDVDESAAVNLELDPGDVEIHHPNILHGSLANTSAERRCGLTIRYIPTTTRITSEEPFPSAVLLRGKPGNNTYQPWPTFLPGHHFPFRDAPLSNRSAINSP